jgi:uncharacterized membrane protein YdbT with pleckstrin-like domain
MGAYIATNLTPNERVIYETKNHWIIFVSLRALFTLLIGPMIDWLTNEFAITDKRIIIKEGLISRRTIEMNLNKVESVGVQQGILGRLLGYGSLIITGTGGSKEPFHNIRAPLEFRKIFQQQLQAHA